MSVGRLSMNLAGDEATRCTFLGHNSESPDVVSDRKGGSRSQGAPRLASGLPMNRGGARLRRALTFLPAKIPGLDGVSPHPGNEFTVPRPGRSERELSLNRSATTRANIQEGAGGLLPGFGVRPPSAAFRARPKAPEGRRTPRRWRDAAHSLRILTTRSAARNRPCE